MKAVRLQGLGLVELVELPPLSIGSGELLLEMRACGLCGTDLSKIFSGEESNGPVSLGHELVGIVAAVGEGVRRFVFGDRVVVAHHVLCGRCRHCRHGNEPMCSQFKAINIDPGGFAELVRIPAAQVEQTAFRLLDFFLDEVGVFMEPLGCALRAVKRSDVQAGDRIAVVGAGSMGLLVG
jgi:L-iditol 2-dehydrogenase